MIKRILWTLMSAAVGLSAGEFPKLTGPYLGQPRPGLVPQIFAPGIVSAGIFARDIAITPDGREIYYSLVIGQNKLSVILYCRMVDNIWTAPKAVPGLDLPEYKYCEPHLSADGNRLYFSSNLPAPGKAFKADDFDIWMAERTAAGWGEPKNLGAPVNTVYGEYFPSLTREGTLYYTGFDPEKKEEVIFRSRLKGGKYQSPEKLPPSVNSGTARFNAFVAPDESYLIVPVFGRPDTRGETDYYVAFRRADGGWSDLVNLGDGINTADGDEYSGSVSPDGKYFFFVSARLPEKDKMPARLTAEYLTKLHNSVPNGSPAIYWVDASVIFKLKPLTKK